MTSRFTSWDRNRWVTLICLMVCAVTSWSFNSWHLDFSTSIHHDEPKKAGFLIRGQQDFMHPVLMLQSVRVTHPKIQEETSWKKVTMMGRSVSAVYGALAVVFFFLFIYLMAGNWVALAVTLPLALSPMMVLHAHYLKEDIYLQCGFMMTLLFHSLWVNKKRWYFLLLLGLALGITLSAHYKSLTYGLVFLTMTVWVGRKFVIRYLGSGFVVAILALLVFAAINYPMFDDLEKFWKGFTFERDHALDGHTVKLWPTAWLFTFHLQKSIVPGLGLIPALLGIAGLVGALWKWKSLKFGEKLLAVFTIVLYFIVEISPLKPHPGYIRYALPTIPGLVYFTYKLFDLSAKRFGIGVKWALLPMVLLVLWEAFFSAKRLDEIVTDTRVIAEEKYESYPGKVIFEKYTNDDGTGIWSLGYLKPDTFTGEPYELFVASNFIYDRYWLGHKLKGQTQSLYVNAEVYKALWDLPYEEVRSDLGPFGFHNSIIRFIDVRGVDLKKLYREAKARGEVQFQKLGTHETK